MRSIHYLYILAAAAFVVSCSEEQEPVKISVDSDAFQFVPTMGGAVMHYKLPDNADIVGIHVRYKDAYDQEILRTGSALCDTMTLVGFNEAKTNIPAQVTFQLYNKQESAPIDVTFSTLDSAPIQFINSVDVQSGWDGFSMDYSCPEGSTGMAHVFYLGTNPHSGEPDTVLMNSFALVEGKYTEIYKNKQNVEQTTVVVKAEDYRGYIVREKVFPNIASVNTAQLDPKKIKIYYTNSLEIPEEKIGLQYLTDGDNRGISWFEDQDDHIYHTFLTGKYGAGEGSVPMYVDMGQLRPTSEVRLYAYRDLGDGVCWDRPCWGPKSYCTGRADGSTCEAVQIFSGAYSNKLPCSVTVYGSRDASDSQDWDSKTWEKLIDYTEDQDASEENRWCYDAADCAGYYSPTSFRTLAKIQAANGIYMPISFKADGQGDGFRYLKLVFNAVFHHSSLEDNPNYKNTYRYMSFHELEIYTKKE